MCIIVMFLHGIDGVELKKIHFTRTCASHTM